MNSNPSKNSVRPFPETNQPERLGPPTTLDAPQQQAARELIEGPRGGVYGPFRPLLHCPALLRSVAKVGETLRFDGKLEPALREWTICVVARELANVFEWDMHFPLAAAAGVPASALAALDAGEPSPADLRADFMLARAVAGEIVTQHRLRETTYAAAVEQWNEPLLVEMITLVGYFAMVCWLMNVARTPATTT